MEKAIITSVQNPVIKRVASLHQAKFRAEYGEFIAEGQRVVQAIMESDIRLVCLYVTDPNQIGSLPSNVSDDQITVVSDNVMKKISSASTPSGILGVFAIPPQPPFSQLSDGIVLAEISDPGNAGTLIRSAAAMERKTVFIVEGVDPWSPKVVQASAGMIATVNIFKIDWQELVAHCKTQKLRLIALVVEGGKKPEQLTFGNSLLVIGNEARGIPDQWLATCDEQMTITMPGKIESLNAAVAGSIALYLAYEHRQ